MYVWLQTISFDVRAHVNFVIDLAYEMGNFRAEGRLLARERASGSSKIELDRTILERLQYNSRGADHARAVPQQ